MLEKGGIIGFPTDTVYGIGCDAYDKKAVERIYELKKRPLHKPLILFIKDKTELPKYVTSIPKVALKLIDKFWPGALTLIFKAKSNCPIKGPNSTIGIRIPGCEPILEILHSYKNPLATTSANLNGTKAPIKDLEVNIKPDFIIKGGGSDEGLPVSHSFSEGLPSTILDITCSPPALLREGKIKKSTLKSIVTETQMP